MAIKPIKKASTDGPVTAGKPKKKKGKFLIIILLILIIAAAIFVGVCYMTKSFIFAPPQKQTGETMDENMPEDSGEGGLSEEELLYQKYKVPESVITFPLEELLINLASDENGKAGYLKTIVSIGFVKEKDAKTFVEKQPIVVDTVIHILRTKTVSEVSDNEQIVLLKQELAKSISRLFDGAQIEIFFTEYIVQ